MNYIWIHTFIKSVLVNMLRSEQRRAIGRNDAGSVSSLSFFKTKEMSAETKIQGVDRLKEND